MNCQGLPTFLNRTVYNLRSSDALSQEMFPFSNQMNTQWKIVNQRVHITSDNGIPGPVRTSIGVLGRQVKHWEFLRGVPNAVKDYYSQCFQH